MILVRHFDRGYGHAKRVDNYWHVHFFDDYDTPVIFHYNAHYHNILHILTEDYDYVE
tara:strand:+ start:368 stop:538 length:171 start_codon:yes stop_codon:yes gene_type:complete